MQCSRGTSEITEIIGVVRGTWHVVQGHRERWTGFETAITVRVSTD